MHDGDFEMGSAAARGGAGALLLTCALLGSACGEVADTEGTGDVRDGLTHRRVVASFEKIIPKGDSFQHRTGHAMVAVKNKLYVTRGVVDDFATQTNTFPEDVLRLQPRAGRVKTLAQRGSPQPGGFSYACAAGDDRGSGSLYLFGGANYVFELRPDFFPSLVVHDDLWRFDVARGTWELIEPTGATPSARSGCAAEFTSGALYLFAGISRFFEVNDELWRFDPATASWSMLEPTGPRPAARYKPAAALDEAEGKIYYYGGLAFGPAGFERLADFWVYDVATNRFRELPSGIAPARDQGAMALLSAPDGRRYVVHVGGDLPTETACVGFPQLASATNEVWAFDIEAERWSLLEKRGPAPRIEYHAGAVLKDRFYITGGWAEEPDPVNTCRQVWNEGFFAMSLTDRSR